MSPPPDGVNANSRWPCERPSALTVSIIPSMHILSNKMKCFISNNGPHSVNHLNKPITHWIGWTCRFFGYKVTGAYEFKISEVFWHFQGREVSPNHVGHFDWRHLINRKHTRPAITLWGRETHICVSKLTIIGPDNGLSPGRRQAIIWTNAEILLIRTRGTNFSEILSEIHSFSLKKSLWKCRLETGGHFVSASMCWISWCPSTTGC